MKTREWILATVVGGALIATSGARADDLEQQVDGKLVAVDTSSGARGQFRLDSHHRTAGSNETINMNASRLGALPDATGHRPVYHVFLIDSTGATATDFGAARLNKGGESQFRFDSRFDDYPSGVTTITAYGGGTFELRRDGAAVLRGSIPAFVGLTDQSTKNSRASYTGNTKLTATINGGGGRGTIQVGVHNEPKHVQQRLRIDVRAIGTLGNPFTVVALDGHGGEATLGTITTNRGAGNGALTLDTHKGDTIPGGGIVALMGQTIEVRNSQGVAVLTGTFPTAP